ncbi:bifunctional aspartate kinase/homoserine dehydrogenase I [Flavobacterium cyanobacteriorum]|uniref:Bifunctional aspartate kinase/homoserine dehydrogenase I n=1 Tax=Flavobacterium cyanobacteriorum TaxID=2022802 RepID=A0A255YRU6_9FLAO|nr:bifunctional aspartate kinase/homoserine dehydrogenase I [Flavobacterium cyanobacteriorum]OYQ31933.1 bifunctional aspartate kinase/homoserine dehydrogenase I [Flavobacterium cyanobacteriorum]
MHIIKFGGTSVANPQNILQCISIIKNKINNGRVAVVVSALGGITDLLLSAALDASAKKLNYKELYNEIEVRHVDAVAGLIPEKNQPESLQNVKQELEHLQTLLDGCYLLGELSERTKDLILSFGEVLSSYIMAEALKVQGEDCRLADCRELIRTNNRFGRAIVNFEITNLHIQHFFDKNRNTVIVLPGFIAQSEDGHVTTLGRGGSDYTAAIVAAALDVPHLEIWTDVSGIYTANPKLVKQARSISHITFEEAMELSHFGAKVLYPPTIQPIINKNITLTIKNTFEPEAPGSIITRQVPEESRNPIKGISNIDGITLITLEGPGMVGVSGFSKRLFEVISKESINVIFITQASSEHSICFGISDAEAPKAKAAIDVEFLFEIRQQKIKPAIAENGLSIIAVVGENMKNHQGLSGRMFSTLGRNNINIRAIAQGASERNISAVIASRDVKKALNSLHEEFFEESTVQLNLFVMGIGNVGDKFLEQVQQQRKYLKEHLNINVRVIGLANSRKMYFDEYGIALKDRKALLENGEPSTHTGFIGAIKRFNLRNSIFIDNTASNEVAMTYGSYLKQSIAVVTCNKVACSSAYSHYSELKSLSRQYSAPFLFETNVGAGLPIIDTLKNLVASGDRIRKIQAVLSGSLNFIFNNFNESVSFHDVVKQAQEEGYTEPDPKIDLSGVDVKRKLVILIRESGYKMEIEDIENRSFLPQKCLDTQTVEDFFRSLQDNATHFGDLYARAKSKGCRLKFVATFEEGNAHVGLEFIPQEHPFYNLEGKDNIVLFYTDRYADQPLIIKGAGAGAAVTASGIFADVIRIGNK